MKSDPNIIIFAFLFSIVTEHPGCRSDPGYGVCRLKQELGAIKIEACFQSLFADAGGNFQNTGWLKLDFASYKFSENEQEFGLRLHVGAQSPHMVSSQEFLKIFRYSGGSLNEVFFAQTGAEDTYDEDQDANCKAQLVLNVLATRTDGFYDWKLSPRKKNVKCDTLDNFESFFYWNGVQYLAK